MRPEEETAVDNAELRILAIETAHPPGSLALAVGGEVVGQAAIEPSQNTTAAFALQIQGLLRQLGWKPQDIDLVATTTGPGSFTGTRIGVTAAKVFAYAAQARVLGVNTLEIIAAQQPTTDYVRVFLDAHRQQLFTAAYAVGEQHFEQHAPTELVEAAALDDLLATDAARWQISPAEIHLAGPGLQRYHELLPRQATLTPAETWSPRAATVAARAAAAFAVGKGQTSWELTPEYFRKSAAEEKADAQNAAKET